MNSVLTELMHGTGGSNWEICSAYLDIRRCNTDGKYNALLCPARILSVPYPQNPHWLQQCIIGEMVLEVYTKSYVASIILIYISPIYMKLKSNFKIFFKKLLIIQLYNIIQQLIILLKGRRLLILLVYLHPVFRVQNYKDPSIQICFSVPAFLNAAGTNKSMSIPCCH
jgi:hypothetical protein